MFSFVILAVDPQMSDLTMTKHPRQFPKSALQRAGAFTKENMEGAQMAVPP